jgi:hypothetical protein
MSIKNEPAFPVPNEANVNQQEGLTKLEYFAGLAMQGAISSERNDFAFSVHEKRAQFAVECAKALIAELEKAQ